MLTRLFCAVLLAMSVSARADTTAPTILHMLDYVGVDYAGAVEGGKIKNADEFKEMIEFTTQVVTLLKTLPANPQQATLIVDAEKLAVMVHEKASAEEIATAAARLRWAIIGAYKMAVAPKRAPDLHIGVRLYQTLCASCHGAGGRGDGPAGARLDPKPSDFHDTARMAQRSAYGLYNTITLGVAGTGMAAFEHLSEDERWALAFYVANFPAADERMSRGETLWKEGKNREAFPDLGNVSTLSANEVKQQFGEEAVATQSYLRAHPGALAREQPSPIAISLSKLEQSVGAYRNGERAAALQFSITAYLEGFELVEASLHNVDSELVLNVEREMMAFRNLLKSGAPLAEVERQAARTESLLEQAQERLSGQSLSPGATFTSALLILLREGLEAILVLAAIIAFVRKTGRRDALPYIHTGWIGALALGAVTWGIATYLVRISGGHREVTEGVTALLAAAMLIYVGFWLHGKAYARAWQQYIKEQVGTALEKKTLWAMAFVSFLAVYREIFEVVLFYQALWAQAGAKGQGGLFAGILVAGAALALIGWLIFRYSVRLPVGPFFSVMSVLLALLAVAFAGQGIAALQEAGVVPADSVDFVTIRTLGVFPTIQTLTVQLVLLTVVIASFYLAGRQRTGEHAQRG
jgi:high-affinity iron transporter